jgi:hypothetical protein
VVNSVSYNPNKNIKGDTRTSCALCWRYVPPYFEVNSFLVLAVSGYFGICSFEFSPSKVG